METTIIYLSLVILLFIALSLWMIARLDYYKSFYAYYKDACGRWSELYAEVCDKRKELFDEAVRTQAIALDLKDAVDEQQELNASLGTEIKSFEIEERHLRNSISKYKDNIVSLKKQVRKLTERNNELERQMIDYDELSQKCSELEASAKDFENKYNVLRRYYDSNNSEDFDE